DAQGFADLQKKAKAAGEDMRVEKLRETIQGDRARVFFLYRDSKGKDSLGMGFALIKEDGQWKLYRALDISEEAQPFDSSFAETKPVNAEPKTSPTETISPPPPALPSVSALNRQPASHSNSSAPTTNSPAPISGGVLNGKAISLPQPAYPPIAKAAKAAGTVAVNVTFDENGRVISASAFAGHPLLRAAAEAAARNARFNPTIVGGKHVKVNGTLTYQFSAP
ncbi:MAG TPA: TonB family protein, partial [Pyrinomonadaceae bacterium]